MEFSYQKIMETLMKINVIEELRGKLFISGGIVPWIINFSGRGGDDYDEH